MDELKPWDRQPGETSKAYEAFSIYRDMGPKRNVRSVAEALGKSGTLITGWSGKYGWVARAAAWDSVPARSVVEAHQAMAQRIAAQHERVATKLMDRLEQNLELLPPGTDPSIKWSTAQSAAHRSHSFATDLTRPESTAKEEITKAIERLVTRLAGEEE